MRSELLRVAIIGAGFGGLSAAKSLTGASFEVTLIDRYNYHQFQPLLYQVATAALPPSVVASPIRAEFRRKPNLSVMLANVSAIDSGRNEVIADGRRLPFDCLIVATGAKRSYFGHATGPRIVARIITKHQGRSAMQMLPCTRLTKIEPQGLIVRQALAYRLPKVAPALCSALLSSGCGTLPVLDPKGPIALAQRQLMFDAVAIMMIVIVPVFIMAGLFIWRYRGTNRQARYMPNLAYYWPAELLIWGVPAGIIFWLSFHLWDGTHRLDPYKGIDTGITPLQVQAVAQDWKWLFIYPEQNIAVVNELVFPSGRPLAIRITSDTVMNSFVIPALGGQIYAMAGMQTRLHLLADEPGEFWGRNIQYSGRGFADQQFRAIATATGDEFEDWIANAESSSDSLDAATYEQLAKPSTKVPVTYYSSVEPDLFDNIITKWRQGGTTHSAPATAGVEQSK